MSASEENRPFATLEDVSVGFFHPEVHYDETMSDLKDLATEPVDKQPVWFRQFKHEASEYLRGNTTGFDAASFSRNVQYPDGSPTMFLRRAWAEVFPHEPIPGTPTRPFDSLFTIAHIYYGDPDPDENPAHPDRLKEQLALPQEKQSPLLRDIKPDLTKYLTGDTDGLNIIELRSETSAYFYRYNKDDKAFARHVWQHLFPDEPLPSA